MFGAASAASTSTFAVVLGGWMKLTHDHCLGAGFKWNISSKTSFPLLQCFSDHGLLSVLFPRLSFLINSLHECQEGISEAFHEDPWKVSGFMSRCIVWCASHPQKKLAFHAEGFCSEAPDMPRRWWLCGPKESIEYAPHRACRLCRIGGTEPTATKNNHGCPPRKKNQK